jgi:hypothetical protein
MLVAIWPICTGVIAIWLKSRPLDGAPGLADEKSIGIVGTAT